MQRSHVLVTTKMQRRATPKKRATDAEKEIDMEEKEATPVEEVESLLPPAEPDRPTQTGDANVLEMLSLIHI